MNVWTDGLSHCETRAYYINSYQITYTHCLHLHDLPSVAPSVLIVHCTHTQSKISWFAMSDADRRHERRSGIRIQQRHGGRSIKLFGWYIFFFLIFSLSIGYTRMWPNVILVGGDFRSIRILTRARNEIKSVTITDYSLQNGEEENIFDNEFVALFWRTGLINGCVRFIPTHRRKWRDSTDRTHFEGIDLCIVRSLLSF